MAKRRPTWDSECILEGQEMVAETPDMGIPHLTVSTLAGLGRPMFLPWARSTTGQDRAMSEGSAEP